MKIQKSTLFIASLLLAGMVSCNADTSDKNDILIDNTSSEAAAPDASAGQQFAGDEAAMPSATTPTTVTVSPTPQPAQNVKLNPAHGQPGHDCAVAVGAPLGGNSAAVQQVAPAAISTTPLPNGLGGPRPQFNANSGNLNPPHGQPGHDCAVAVGAPLPS